MASKPRLNARNANGARDLFEKRKDYDVYAIRTTQNRNVPARTGGENPVELGAIKDFTRDSRYLIGKASVEQYSILPDSSRIQKIKAVGDRRTVSAFDFVANSFDAMVKRYDQIIAANRIVPNENGSTELEVIRAVKGYSSSFRNYTEYNKGYYRLVVDNIPKARKDNISNLRDFLKIYSEVLLSGARSVPYFLSDYIRSDFNSQLTTGLVIEISSARYSDDGYKVENFLKSPNFQRYAKLAQEFGFMIDKKIPWRLVADIDSKAMRSRLMQLERDTEDVTSILQQYYTLVDTNDFIIMLNDVYAAYNFFIKNNSFANKTSSRQQEECSSKVIVREPIQITELSQIPTTEWVSLFVRLKNKFSGLMMNEKELSRIVILESQKVNYTSLENIVTSINRKFNFTPFDQGSATYKELEVKLRQSESLTDPLQQIKDFYVASLMNQY